MNAKTLRKTFLVVLLAFLAPTLVFAGSGKALLSAGPEIPSLVGVEPDGAVRIGSDGVLVVDRDLRLFYDHFLAARGEVDAAVLSERVAAELALRLPSSAAAEATGLFEDYERYFEIARRRTMPRAGDDIAAAFKALRKVRVEVLGAETARAFFGADEAHEDAALRLATVKDADPATREQALRDLETLYPKAEREARAESLKALESHRLVAELRAEGAGEGEIFEARADVFGDEAAERLASLDRERAAWNERLQSFRDVRAAIEADASLSVQEKKSVVEALRSERFTERELLRVDALDRIASDL